MGIRAMLNEKPLLAVGVAAAILIIALAAIYWQLTPSPGGDANAPVLAFFSGDDGAGYFSAELKELPPFQKDDREVAMAAVFRCEGKPQPFVGYLVRFSPAAQQQFARHVQSRPGGRAAPQMARWSEYEETEVMVKPPGAGPWLSLADPAGRGIIAGVKCPGGEPALPLLP